MAAGFRWASSRRCGQEPVPAEGLASARRNRPAQWPPREVPGDSATSKQPFSEAEATDRVQSEAAVGADPLEGYAAELICASTSRNHIASTAAKLIVNTTPRSLTLSVRV